MNKKLLRFIFSVALMTSVTVNAEELFVQYGGAGSNCTEASPCGYIQAAVDAAAPGDEIHIGTGTFVENVRILPGKDGVSLVGSGPQTIIESMGGVPGICAPCNIYGIDADIVVDVLSSNVVIRDLSIVHPGEIAPVKRDLGVFVRPPAHNVAIKNVHFNREHIGETGLIPGSRGVFVFLAPGTEITNNTFRGNYQDAIHIPTREAAVLNNDIADAPRVGIVIIQEPGGSPAVDSIVKGNVVKNSGNDGIQIQGDRNVVMKNTVTNSGGAGIKLCGAQLGDCVEPGDSTIAAVAEDNFVKSNTLLGNNVDVVVDNGEGNTVK